MADTTGFVTPTAQNIDTGGAEDAAPQDAPSSQNGTSQNGIPQNGVQEHQPADHGPASGMSEGGSPSEDGFLQGAAGGNEASTEAGSADGAANPSEGAQEGGSDDPSGMSPEELARKQQSRADKLEAQLRQYREQVDPVLDWLNDPENYRAVQAAIQQRRGGQTPVGAGDDPHGQGAAATQPSVDSRQGQAASEAAIDPSDLTPPEVPEDPYDEAGWKAYREKQVRYNKAVARFVQQQMEREQRAAQARQQEAARERQLLQMRKEVAQSYGVSEHVAAAFLQDLQTPEMQQKLQDQVFKAWQVQRQAHLPANGNGQQGAREGGQPQADQQQPQNGRVDPARARQFEQGRTQQVPVIPGAAVGGSGSAPAGATETSSPLYGFVTRR